MAARAADFTSQEFDDAFYDVIQKSIVSAALSPHDVPSAYLLGGQSGAGKTTLHRILRYRLDDDVIVINGDEFRSLHPRFYELQEAYGDDAVSYTAPWAGQMVEELVDQLSRLKYNLVVEGTLRTADVPLGTAQLLRERGYGVSLALMAVKPEISLLSCQLRYEEMRIAGTTPRATDPEHHRRIVDQIVSNLSVLEGSGAFDGIELYGRSAARLYPAEGEDRSASRALSDILFGEWTAEELAHRAFLEEWLAELRRR